MKKRIIMALAVIMTVGLVQAATVEYNFDAGNGAPSANTLNVGAGTIQTMVEPVDDRFGAYYVNGRVELSEAKDIDSALDFTVYIPAGVSVDLTTLDFEYGFAEYYAPNPLTPTWSLAISTGSGAPASGGLPTITEDGYTSTNETVALSGLTGLSDTSVTFTFTFDTDEDRENWQRRHAIDQLVLTGTTSGSSTEAPMIQDFGTSNTNPPAGGTVTLSWNTVFEDTLSIDQGVGDVTGLSSKDVVVAADTTYTLTAINSNGTTTEVLPISVLTTLPVINSFAVSEDQVLAGTPVTLSWNVDDAASVTLEPGIGDVTGITSTQVVISADSTFTLTALSGTGSTNAVQTVTEVVDPPTINSFSASKTAVQPGETVILQWNVDHATGLSIDQGLGDVLGLTSTQVVVNATISYALTATNEFGASVETVNISIAGAPSEVLSVDFTDSAASGSVGSPTSAANLDLGTDGGTWSDISTTSGIGFEGEVTVTDADRGWMTGRHLFFGRLTNQSGGDHLSTATLTLDKPQALDGVVFSLDAEVDNSGSQPSLGLMVDIYDGTTLLLSLNFGTSISPGYRYSIGELDAADQLQQNLFSSAEGSRVFEANDTGATVGINLGASSYTVGAVSEVNGDLGLSSVLSYLNSATTFDKIIFTAQGSKASWGLDNLALEVPGATTDPVFVSIYGPVSGGNGMVISWMSDSRASYTVETNSNLIISSGWDVFESGLPGTGDQMSVTNTIDPDQIFYRVITE